MVNMQTGEHAEEEKLTKHLILMTSILSGLMLFTGSAGAEASSFSTGSPAVFASTDDSQATVNDSAQAIRAAKHRLSIFDRTPTPTEGYRWPTTNIKIYMDTQDRALQTAFRSAVQAWNQSGVVHISWTKNKDKADIIAQDGVLPNGRSTPGIGYETTQLGSTSAEYNPDTHALIQARSTLDPNQLDYTSQRFRTEVAEHELGHALGLAHAPENMHSVMIPQNVKSGITVNDRRTLRYLYDRD